MEGKDRFPPGVFIGRGNLFVDDLGIDERALYTYRSRERWDRRRPPYVDFEKGHQLEGVP